MTGIASISTTSATLSSHRAGRAQSVGYTTVIAIIAAIAAAPIVIAVTSVFTDTGDIWGHLATYVLPEALMNTMWLVVGVAAVAGTIGVALAWVVAVYDFPGRSFFNWALLLPMAMPGYVLAFAFAALFEYTGPLQTLWRDGLGNPFGFPDIGARSASILTLSLVLYPYVFLIVREAFSTQGIRSLEVAQSCGLRPLQGFLKVSLPMARPFIVAGISLATMECLADFGTVKIYNYTTFTTAIYQSWFGLFSLESALQLSLVLIVLVFIALGVERRLRGRASYATAGTAARVRRKRLTGRRAAAATLLCTVVFVIAFAIPASLIAKWSIGSFAGEFDSRYWQFAANTLMLSVIAAGLITAVAVVLAHSVRRQPGGINPLLARIATLGYAIPGTVLAIGFFVCVAALSKLANYLFSPAGSAPIALQGGLMVVLLAYLSRYLAVAYSPVDSALSRIRPSIEDASRGMGVAGLAMLRKVHMPILRPAIFTAALLVFVDVMKELPITLMTRPFGWDTLAVRVFQLTTEGEWERAALPALAIVLAGVLPVILLTKKRDNAAG